MMPAGVKSKDSSTIACISSIDFFSDSKVLINIDVGFTTPIA